MAWKHHKIGVETRPPNSNSQRQLSRWFYLADIALHQQEPSSREASRASSRTQEEHERLKDELRKAVEIPQPRAVMKRVS
jgi:hypothetical protein